MLIYNKNTKEIDVVEEEQIEELKKTAKIRMFLEKNKIFIDAFSFLLPLAMSVIVFIVSIRTDNKIIKIYEKQLEIEENDRKPHFTLESESVWEKVEETVGTDKIAKRRYVITNTGGNISNVSVYAESQVLFYVPTGEENEWYIFEYRTHNFDINYVEPQRQEEKDRKFVFYEYTSEKNINEISDRNWELGKYLSENLNDGVTHQARWIMNITYTDYIGKTQNKLFEFDPLQMWEVDEEEERVRVGVALDFVITDEKTGSVTLPIDINDSQAVGKVIKGDIEDWLEKNKGKKGYKDLDYVWYNYNLKP